MHFNLFPPSVSRWPFISHPRPIQASPPLVCQALVGYCFAPVTIPPFTLGTSLTTTTWETFVAMRIASLKWALRLRESALPPLHGIFLSDVGACETWKTEIPWIIKSMWIMASFKLTLIPHHISHHLLLLLPLGNSHTLVLMMMWDKI